MGFELHDPPRLLETLRALPRETDWLEFKVSTFDAVSTGQYVSGLANAAMFERQKLAYMVWGVEDQTHEIVGTSVTGTREEGVRRFSSFPLEISQAVFERASSSFRCKW
jgi:predicted HTH transcriptional regulator